VGQLGRKRSNSPQTCKRSSTLGPTCPKPSGPAFWRWLKARRDGRASGSSDAAKHLKNEPPENDE
jgi:hypothetical protein